ncbi:unnamed protein product [Caenorhabditis bovis]|uniref:Uncharacterized protein n=1 Tax=Caenorhabditis bovis TaxID=2654633 RepID=A0A8S1EHW3_9PELO|nr:unnamed protein product [Caenorhabditis bovis]
MLHFWSALTRVYILQGCKGGKCCKCTVDHLFGLPKNNDCDFYPDQEKLLNFILCNYRIENPSFSFEQRIMMMRHCLEGKLIEKKRLLKRIIKWMCFNEKGRFDAIKFRRITLPVMAMVFQFMKSYKGLMMLIRKILAYDQSSGQILFGTAFATLIRFGIKAYEPYAITFHALGPSYRQYLQISSQYSIYTVDAKLFEPTGYIDFRNDFKSLLSSFDKQFLANCMNNYARNFDLIFKDDFSCALREFYEVVSVVVFMILPHSDILYKMTRAILMMLDEEKIQHNNMEHIKLFTDLLPLSITTRPSYMKPGRVPLLINDIVSVITTVCNGSRKDFQNELAVLEAVTPLMKCLGNMSKTLKILPEKSTEKRRLIPKWIFDILSLINPDQISRKGDNRNNGYYTRLELGYNLTLMARYDLAFEKNPNYALRMLASCDLNYLEKSKFNFKLAKAAWFRMRPFLKCETLDIIRGILWRLHSRDPNDRSSDVERMICVDLCSDNKEIRKDAQAKFQKLYQRVPKFPKRKEFSTALVVARIF